MKHPLHAPVKFPQAEDIREKLEKRLGRLHARQRLGIEKDHEGQVFGQGMRFLHIENLLFSRSLIEGVLRLSGLYWQGRRNACKIRVKHNDIVSRRVPRPFDGFRILHLSDLHTDMSEPAMSRILDLLPGLEYDLCVLTGDYRGKTFGSFDLALARMARLREALNGPVFGVLGNHDTIQMIPGLEGMGIRMRSTKVLASIAAGNGFIWQGLMTPIFTEWTISKKRRTRSRTKNSRSFCLTRQKFTGRPHMLDLICC